MERKKETTRRKQSGSEGRRWALPRRKEGRETSWVAGWGRRKSEVSTQVPKHSSMTGAAHGDT